MSYEKELKIATQLAKQAGKIMLDYFEKEQEIEYKEDDSPLTIADTKINTMVIKELEDQTPVSGIVRWRRAWGEAMQIPGIGVQLGDMPQAQLEDFSAKAKLPESDTD